MCHLCIEASSPSELIQHGQQRLLDGDLAHHDRAGDYLFRMLSYPSRDHEDVLYYKAHSVPRDQQASLLQLTVKGVDGRAQSLQGKWKLSGAELDRAAYMCRKYWRPPGSTS